MTPDEIEAVKNTALSQGIDLTQIAIVYCSGGQSASGMGSSTADGRTVDCDGNPLSAEDIIRFHYLAGD